eukprot:3359493-Pleurochrysis_carterae.AAC.1
MERRERLLNAQPDSDADHRDNDHVNDNAIGDLHTDDIDLYEGDALKDDDFVFASDDEINTGEETDELIMRDDDDDTNDVPGTDDDDNELVIDLTTFAAYLERYHQDDFTTIQALLKTFKEQAAASGDATVASVDSLRAFMPRAEVQLIKTKYANMGRDYEEHITSDAMHELLQNILGTLGLAAFFVFFLVAWIATGRHKKSKCCRFICGFVDKVRRSRSVPDGAMQLSDTSQQVSPHPNQKLDGGPDPKKVVVTIVEGIPTHVQPVPTSEMDSPKLRPSSAKPATK